MKISTQILLTIAVLVLGSAGLVGIVFIPSFNGIIQLSQTIEDEIIKTEKTSQRALNLRKSIESIEKIEKALPDIESMLVKKGDEVKLFTFIKEKTRENSLEDTLRLGEINDSGPNIDQLPISIDLNGSFPNAIRFIAEIEKSQIFLPFNTASMRLIQSNSEDKGEFITSLKGTAYVTENK